MSTASLDSPTAGATTAFTKRRRKIKPGDVVLGVAVAILLIITLFPFYWSLRTAFSTNSALPSNSTKLLPVNFTLSGFERALGR